MIDITGINGEMLVWGTVLALSIWYFIKSEREHRAAKAAEAKAAKAQAATAAANAAADETPGQK